MRIVRVGKTHWMGCLPGIVGKAIVKEALEKGHQVTVLTRDAKKFPTDHNHLRIIEGDVTDRQVIHRVLENQNAVIH